MPRLDLIPNPREGDAPGHCFGPAPTGHLGSKFPFQKLPVFTDAGATLAAIGMRLSWRTFPWIKGESGYSQLPKGRKYCEELRYFGKAP